MVFNRKWLTRVLFLFVSTSLFLCYRDSRAESFSSNRRKPGAELYWSLFLNVLPTYHAMLNSNGSAVPAALTVLPGINGGIIRNYTDSFFIMFSGAIAPSYATIGSDGSSRGNGFYTTVSFSIGHDIFHVNKHFLSVIGGVRGIFNDISIHPLNSAVSVTSNLQSNIHFGAVVFVGLYGQIQITEKQALSVTATFGSGPYGAIFVTNSDSKGSGSVWKNGIVPTVAFVGNVSFAHTIKITKRDFFRWFIGAEAPFIYVPHSTNSPQAGSLINYITVTAGFGFSYVL